MGVPAWYQLEPEQVAEILNTDIETGLRDKEARLRLKKWGLNELKEGKKETLWQKFLFQFTDFLVLILLGATVVSMLLGEYIDAMVIIAIVILNAALGVIQEARAEKALAALKKMGSPQARVIRDGNLRKIPVPQLVPGDLVVIEAGDYVPADIRLTESVNLKIEEASLSGESVAVEKRAKARYQEQVPLGDRKNMAYMSTLVTYGRGKGLVVATGMRTEIGLIAELITTMESEQTPLQERLEKLGKLLGIACLVICGVVFVAGVVRGEPLLEMFMTAVSLAVAAIPEGLPAVVTIVLAIGMQRMSKNQAIIRKLPAVETLGCATVICSDKTGTLTQNQMTVTRLYSNGKVIEVTGEGYNPRGEFRTAGKINHLHTDYDLLLTIGAICNDATLSQKEGKGHQNSRWQIIGDPTEGALVVAAAKAGLWQKDLAKQYPRIGEIPFDSARKRMTTIHSLRGKRENWACVKGAPEEILDRSAKIWLNGQAIPLTGKMREEVRQQNSAFAQRALRVLACAYRVLPSYPVNLVPEEIERDLVFVGLIGMIDPPRSEILDAVLECKRAGIRPVMITGDYADTARAIAREIGILREQGEVVTGSEVARLSEEQLSKRVENIDVFARVSPEHKMKIVSALQSAGEIVAMTGDGVNDAPALKKADIGVAMGITGTDVAKETADMVLADDNFASIVRAIKEGRIIYANIRKFVFYLLSCNVGEILVVFGAMLLNLPMPLKPIQLLWLNLVTDSFPALALGMEKGEPDIMHQPPRNAREGIITGHLAFGIAIQSTMLTFATLLSVIIALSKHGHNLAYARTFAFATLITGELLRAYSCRSERYPLSNIGVFSNRFMTLATLLSFLLLLTVIYVPPLPTIFDTVHLDLNSWATIGSLAVLPLLAAEFGKMLFFRRVR